MFNYLVFYLISPNVFIPNIYFHFFWSLPLITDINDNIILDSLLYIYYIMAHTT